jgi:hypothetical protein
MIMTKRHPDHTLEFLLGFDGRLHHYPEGYYLKFEIRRTEPTTERPHGLRYSFSLHGPDGTRLIGFDNAHTVPVAGSRFSSRPDEADHWHRSGSDPGRPYAFQNAAKLLEDFFDEVERVLMERGIEPVVVADEEGNRR